MSEETPSTSGTSTLQLNKLPRGAISITGTPLGRNVRLPSIKGPRDLTLGSSSKRTFTPNIPVRRERRMENNAVKSSQNIKEETSDSRGRGRGKLKKSFIQTPGAVFGEGVTNHTKNLAYKNSQYKSTSGSSSSAAAVPKPVFKSEVVVKTEKPDYDDDAELSDNFIDDSDASDEEKNMLPVSVPIRGTLGQGQIQKKDTEDDYKQKCQTIKQENPSDALKPDVIEPESFEKLALQSDFMGSDDLFLMEFPDYFGFPEQTGQQYECSSQKHEADSRGQPSSSCAPPTRWSNMDDGYMGKLQFLRNGNCQLVVGSHKFEVSLKRPSPFLQELISVNSCDNKTEMTLIGHVKHEVRCRPNVMELIEKGGKNS